VVQPPVQPGRGHRGLAPRQVQGHLWLGRLGQVLVAPEQRLSLFQPFLRSEARRVAGVDAASPLPAGLESLVSVSHFSPSSHCPAAPSTSAQQVPQHVRTPGWLFRFM